MGKCKKGFKVFNNSNPVNLCLTDWVVDMVQKAKANLNNLRAQEG